MVLFCGAIVGLCGFDFRVEVAEREVLVVENNGGDPFFIVFVPTDAFELRGGWRGILSTVVAVLSVGCGAEVCLAIIEAIAVSMVNEEAI